MLFLRSPGSKVTKINLLFAIVLMASGWFCDLTALAYTVGLAGSHLPLIKFRYSLICQVSHIESELRLVPVSCI